MASAPFFPVGALAPAPPARGLPPGAIAGIVLGSVAGAVLLALLGLLLFRRRQRHKAGWVKDDLNGGSMDHGLHIGADSAAVGGRVSGGLGTVGGGGARGGVGSGEGPVPYSSAIQMLRVGQAV